jgi:hypothetical protein
MACPIGFPGSACTARKPWIRALIRSFDDLDPKGLRQRVVLEQGPDDVLVVFPLDEQDAPGRFHRKSI